MFNKVLVPLDFSRLAEYALPPAIKIVQQAQGELTLLNVLERHVVLIPEGPEMMGHNLYHPETSLNQEAEAAHKYFNDLQSGFGRAYTDLAWKTRIEEGDPASCIIDLAEDEAIDLVVMSTHGYSGMTRWFLGSVAEKVLRHVACPVLIVREEFAIKRIVITLDGSVLAESSLPFGLDVAEAFAFGAEVTLLYVDELSEKVDANKIENLNKDEPGLGDRYRQEFQLKAETYLNHVRQTYGRNNLNIKTAVRYGKPAHAILNFAEDNEIDLIVMSTHGRTGLARWRYGSVTEKVLHSADCAMLIYRPEEMELP